MDALQSANLAVRFLQQLCALAPLAYWGARTRSRLLTKVALGVGAPSRCRGAWSSTISTVLAIG